MVPHGLLHALASYFPLWWYLHRYPERRELPALASLRADPELWAELPGRIGQLFHPGNVCFPLGILAIVIGHGGPETIANYYIHTFDWLQRLDVEWEDTRARAGTVRPAVADQLRVSIGEATRALGGDRKTADYATFRQATRAGGVSAIEVVEAQVPRLDALRDAQRGQPGRHGDSVAEPSRPAVDPG